MCNHSSAETTSSDETSPTDPSRRQFLITAASVVGAVGVAGASVPLVSSWWPSAREQAAAGPIRVDVSGVKPGQHITVSWHGKPIWIIRRTAEMLQSLVGHETALRDPDSLVQQQPDYINKPYRSIHPEWLVLVGLCTHLGCSPNYKPQPHSVSADWPGGFFCPCHGSKFDLAGRVYKGSPAPVNLVVPPYRFINDAELIIGEEPTEGV